MAEMNGIERAAEDPDPHEPVFMVLGQSSATAAVMAIDAKSAVQKIDVQKLKERLLADKQVLEWKGGGGAASGVDAKSLKGLVLDDDALAKKGDWTSSASISGFIGTQYWHDNNEAKGEKEARFTGKVEKAGEYEIRLAYAANPNRATNVPVTIEHSGGTLTTRVDQKKAPPVEKMFVSLGKFKLSPEKPLTVTIANKDTDGYVIVDAVWVVPSN